MSIRTAPQHTAAELAFVAADHVTGIVEFAAASKSRPGEAHVVSLDTTNGAIHCTCKGAECGRRCWHADHVAAAWLPTPAMQQVRWLSDESLVRHGKKARSMVTIYAARIGRILPADALSLVAAGCEWRRRVAAARALDTDLAARQTVAVWESLSYSDRHSDRHVDGSRGEREYLTARATLAALASGPFDAAPLLAA